MVAIQVFQARSKKPHLCFQLACCIYHSMSGPSKGITPEERERLISNLLQVQQLLKECASTAAGDLPKLAEAQAKLGVTLSRLQHGTPTKALQQQPQQQLKRPGVCSYTSFFRYLLACLLAGFSFNSFAHPILHSYTTSCP